MWSACRQISHTTQGGVFATNATIQRMTSATIATTTLTITRPDDWHLHVRDGDALGF